LGQELLRLDDIPAGHTEISLSSSPLSTASGLLIYELRTPAQRRSGKLLILR